MSTSHFSWTASFVLATGVCVLSRPRPTVTFSILGPSRSAPLALTLAQAFNSFGSAFWAPLGGGILHLTDNTKITDPEGDCALPLWGR